MKFKFIALLVLLSVSLRIYAKEESLQTGLLLKYRVKEPAKRNNKTKLIILLHGYGSNEGDLMSLFAMLPADAVIVSAQAPVELRPNAYAWYSIGRAGAAIEKIDEEKKSQQLINGFIDQVAKKYNIPPSRIVLIGFSQGAIMSLCTALTQPSKIRGIAVLSGRLLDEVKPLAVSADKINKVSVFIAHGTEDKVLPIQYGKEEKAFLDSKHISCEYHEYPMVHTILDAEMSDVRNWLSKL